MLLRIYTNSKNPINSSPVFSSAQCSACATPSPADATMCRICLPHPLGWTRRTHTRFPLAGPLRHKVFGCGLLQHEWRVRLLEPSSPLIRRSHVSNGVMLVGVLRRRKRRVMLCGRLSRIARGRRVIVLVETVSERTEGPVADNGDGRNRSKEKHLQY